MDNFVELRQVITLLLSRWWLLLLGGVLGGLAGFGVSRLQTPVYEAVTTIYIGRSVASLNVARQDLQVGEQLVLTYADLARRQPVLQGVITTLNLSTTWQKLKNQVRARPIENTQLLEIAARAESAQAAQQIANTLADELIQASSNANANPQEGSISEQFARQRLERLQRKITLAQQRVETLESLMGNAVNESTEKLATLQNEMKTLETLLADWDNTYSRLLAAVRTEESTNRLSVVEPAELDPDPVQPQVPINILLAAMVGLALTAVLLFLLDHWDTSLRTSTDIAASLGLPTLASIARSKRRGEQQKLVFNRSDTAAIAEEYRLLRSKLQYIATDWPRKVLLVASLTPTEQSSLIVANLGAVMALAGLKTIVIDANLRQPHQHELFQLSNRRGLSELLMSPVHDLAIYLQNTSVQNLQLLTAGGIPTYPAELLSSGRMKNLIAELTTSVDVVICDCADTSTFADAAALVGYMDGVLLTVEAGKISGNAAQQIAYNLQQTGANLLGAVLLAPAKQRLLAPVAQPLTPPQPKTSNRTVEGAYTAVESLPTNAAD